MLKNLKQKLLPGKWISKLGFLFNEICTLTKISGVLDSQKIEEGIVHIVYISLGNKDQKMWNSGNNLYRS